MKNLKETKPEPEPEKKPELSNEGELEEKELEKVSGGLKAPPNTASPI